MTRETWHEGMERHGDLMGWGHPQCAGCGRILGLACLAIPPGYTPPPVPTWPFDEHGCPLCTLRDQVMELRHQLDTPADKLTKRMVALRSKPAT